MAIESFYPRPRPSLDLNFAAGNFDPRITFSRASAATYYDGRTTAKAEENLLVRSQEFDNASWGKLRTDVLNVYTAPDGTLTAKESRPDEALDRHFAYQWYVTGKAGKSYTASVYVRANGYNYFAIGFEDNTHGAKKSYIFDLLGSSATLLYSAGDSIFSNASATITSVGGGWFRCTMTATCVNDLASYLTLQLGPSPTATPTISHGMPYFAGDGASGIYLWGAQLEQRSQVTAYTPTTTQPITNYIPVLQTALSGVPRIDHDPVTGECKGLLIEEYRTNLLTYSDQFDNAAWSKGSATVSANSVVAPDGSLGADMVSASASYGGVYTSFAGSAVSYTYSVFAKKGTSDSLYVKANNAGQIAYYAFNLSAGTFAASSGAGSATMAPVGNGWYRVSVTPANVASGTSYFEILSSTTGTFYLWGAQVETGAFPTSYIPTTSAQVTRAADSASMTGANFSSWYRQDEGTLCAEVNVPFSASYTTRLFAVDDGTSNNVLQGQYNSSAQMTFALDVGGANKFALNKSGNTFGTPHKFIGSYKSGDAAFGVDGSGVSLSNSSWAGFVPTTLRIGMAFGGGQQPNGHIKRIAYYAESLPEYLQALTS